MNRYYTFCKFSLCMRNVDKIHDSNSSVLCISSLGSLVVLCVLNMTKLFIKSTEWQQ